MSTLLYVDFFVLINTMPFNLYRVLYLASLFPKIKCCFFQDFHGKRSAQRQSYGDFAIKRIVIMVQVV